MADGDDGVAREPPSKRQCVPPDSAPNTHPEHEEPGGVITLEEDACARSNIDEHVLGTKVVATRLSGCENVVSVIDHKDDCHDERGGEGQDDDECLKVDSFEDSRASEEEDIETDEDDDDEALEVAAFEYALSAHMEDGHSISDAVRMIFSSAKNVVLNCESASDNVATDVPQDDDVAVPILSAIESDPLLSQNVKMVAHLCAYAYRKVEADNFLRKARHRNRLDLAIKSLCDVAQLIDKANNVVVLSGAGVSVSCGIPDFRSKGGIYETVLKRYGLTEPEAIFDLEEFKMDPTLFFSFAKDIMPSGTITPSLTHFFIAQLDQKKKLLRNYSQNIDGLEHLAGISPERVVLCHGSFLTATCMRKTCRMKVSGQDIFPDVHAGRVPICPTCSTEGSAQESSDDDELDEPGGDRSSVLKPDIVFFGEPLPSAVSDRLEHDVALADLVLVLGTSLKVAPVARIPLQFPNSVPLVLVNRELVGYNFDIELLGDCDVVVRELCRVLGWPARSDMKNNDMKTNEGHVLSAEPSDPPRSLFSDDVYRSSQDKCEISVDTSATATMAKDDTGINAHTADASNSEDHVGIMFVPPRQFIFPGATVSHIEGSNSETIVVRDSEANQNKSDRVDLADDNRREQENLICSATRGHQDVLNILAEGDRLGIALEAQASNPSVAGSQNDLGDD